MKEPAPSYVTDVRASAVVSAPAFTSLPLAAAAGAAPRSMTAAVPTTVRAAAPNALPSTPRRLITPSDLAGAFAGLPSAPFSGEDALATWRRWYLVGTRPVGRGGTAHKRRHAPAEVGVFQRQPRTYSFQFLQLGGQCIDLVWACLGHLDLLIGGNPVGRHLR